MVMKRSLMNYRGDTNVPFIKITVQDQRSLPKARDKYFFSSHCRIQEAYLAWCPRVFERETFQFRDLQIGSATYESNIPYTLRFMIDTKVSPLTAVTPAALNPTYQLVGMNWIEVPPGGYTLRQNKTSHCQLEFSMK